MDVSVMAGTFQVLSSPQPCTGSQALCFLAGAGKEGGFQVTFPSPSPSPHQTSLRGLESRVSRFPGWELHSTTDCGSQRCGGDVGAEASEVESEASLGRLHFWVQDGLPGAPAGMWSHCLRLPELPSKMGGALSGSSLEGDVSTLGIQ